MSESWWYRATDGRKVGPLSWEELRVLAGTGRVRPENLVRSGSGPKRAAAEVPGLLTGPPRPAGPGAPVPTGDGPAESRWKAWAACAGGVALIVACGVAKQAARPPEAQAPPRQDQPRQVAHAGPPTDTALPRAAGEGTPPPPAAKTATVAPVAGAPFGKARPPAAAVSQPFPAAPPPPAFAGDERLFLLYKLERLYLGLPFAAADPDQFLAATGAVRRSAAAHAADLRERNYDPAVVSAYQDLVADVDDRLGLAAALGRVEREAVARLQAERAETGFRAGFAGGGFGAAMADGGASGTDALAGAAAVGLFAYFLDDLKKDGERDEARRAAREAVVREHQRRSEARLERLRAVVGRMADAHRWPRGSVPVVDPPYTPEALARLVSAVDVPGLYRLFDGAAARRPLDPFTPLEVASLASKRFESEHARVPGRAAACVKAVALVPPGRAYDEDRVALWHSAAWLEMVAAELGDDAATGRAKLNVAAALALDPADAPGDLRALKAFILQDCGDPDAALGLMDEVATLRKSDRLFAARYVLLLTESGRLRSGIEWLRHLVTACGYEDVAALRADPTLAPLARHDPKEWDRLTVPAWAWALDRGVFSDDVVVTNASPFPLTRVALRPVVEKGGRTWTHALAAERIEAGETFRWKDVRGIPGGPPDAATATLACDQVAKR